MGLPARCSAMRCGCCPPMSGWRAGEFGAVVADHHLRLAALDHQPVQFPRHADAGERGVGHQRQALGGAIIDDGQDAEAAAAGQLIPHKVERLCVEPGARMIVGELDICHERTFVHYLDSRSSASRSVSLTTRIGKTMKCLPDVG